MRNIISLVLILGCAAAASAREEYTRDFGKSVPLAAGRTFRLESQFGRISIHAAPKATVDIRATVRCSANNTDEARQCADRIAIVVDESAAGVSVRTDYSRNNNRRNLSYKVDYDIAMPDSCPLELRNRFGAAEITGLHAAASINSGNGSVAFLDGRGSQRIENSFGQVEVRRNGGDVTINNTNGPTIAADIAGAVDITNRFGEIRVSNAGRGVTLRSNNSNIEVSNAGGPVNVSNSFGRVAIWDIKSDAAVQNQNGEISATGIAGSANLHTSFAGIQFSRIGKTLTVNATNSTVRGDTVGESATVATTFGGVSLRDVQGAARVTAANAYVKLAGIGGEAYAKTTFAPVDISDAAGPITVEGQNSSVTVMARAARACRPIALRTSFGPIRVTLPQGIGYDVTAHTTFGRIHTDPVVQIAVSGDIGQNGLTGKIGGGGCELRLTDQNGEINILR